MLGGAFKNWLKSKRIKKGFLIKNFLSSSPQKLIGKGTGYIKKSLEFNIKITRLKCQMEIGT